MKQYEKFYARIRKEKSHMIITIPINNVKFAEYKEGDTLTIMAKKMEVGDFEKKI